MSSVLARAVVVLEGDAKGLDKMMSAAEQRVMRAGKLMGDVGSKLTTRVSLPLAAMGALSVKAFAEQEDAIAKTNAIIRATGASAGVTTDHLMGLSDQLQQTTVYADEVVMSGAAMLLTFGNIRNEVGAGNDIFDRTVKISADLAAALGGDLADAMFMVGKAMTDPEEGLMMLQRRTRAFTDEQEAQIKKLMESGHLMEAQTLILTTLEGRIGGVSAAMAQTPMGQLKQAWNQLGEAMEDIGGIMTGPVLAGATGVRKMAAAFQDLSPTAKVAIVMIGAIVGAIGPLLVGIGLAIKAFLALKVILGGAAMMGTIGLFIAGIGMLIAVGVTLARNWTAVQIHFVAMWAAIKDTFFTAIDFILGAIQKLMEGTAGLFNMLDRLPGLAGKLGGALGSRLARPAEMAAEGIDGLRDSLDRMAENSLREAGAALQFLNEELAYTDGAAKKLTETVTRRPPPAATQWPKEVSDALTEFSAAMREAANMEKLLGAEFDRTSAEAAAHEALLTTLARAGISLTATVGPAGETVRQLADRLLGLRGELQEVEAAQQKGSDAAALWEEKMSMARAAVEAALTPTQTYEQTMDALRAALDAGTISQEQFNAAVEKAKETMEEATRHTIDLGRVMQDLAGRAVDDFVDAVFGAKKSFSEFVRQALADIAKLILKMYILNALFPEGSGKGGILGDLLGFARGGFLQPGGVGIVGEKGPELISGGRTGITVTPFPAHGVSGGGELATAGGGMIVNLNVHAIDAQGVAEFFERNEQLVAGAMMRANQRSRALLHSLGR